jgi:hypothetical protein
MTRILPSQLFVAQSLLAVPFIPGLSSCRGRTLVRPAGLPTESGQVPVGLYKTLAIEEERKKDAHLRRRPLQGKGGGWQVR